MRIGYLSLDEVNQSLARQLASKIGVELHSLSFREDEPVGSCDAYLYELDCLTQLDRRELLARIVAGPAQRPAAVHSWNVSPNERRALHGKGVDVFRRLEEVVFRRLRRAVRARRRQAQRLSTT